MDRAKKKLVRILLTNIFLCDGSGTETLIRDLSLALRRRGHAVICYAPTIGRIGAEIRASGTPVVQSLISVAEAPDIIHGHHSGPTMTALARFRDAPAVFVCHDWSSVYDDPPLHPRIGRYLYVRHVLRERLVSEKNIPPERVQFWGNTVDFTRVDQPKVLPSRPRTAGAYCHVGMIPYLSALADACAERDITFLGELLSEHGYRSHAERVLSRCDLVFASGRMAIEAIGAGCAVINADRFGIGGLVTNVKLDEFLAANFAIGGLSIPPSKTTFLQALDEYDASDAAVVTARVRRDCNIAAGAERLEAIYQKILDEAAIVPADRASEDLVYARYLEENSQLGRLYNSGFARRIFTPTSEDELHDMLQKLSMRVEHLSLAIDGLSFMRVFRAVRTWWKRRRVVPVHFSRGAKTRNVSNPGKPSAVSGAQIVEGTASGPTRQPP